MKTRKTLLIAIPIMLMLCSCLKVHEHSGKAEIISRNTDNSLNGKSIVYGAVYDYRGEQLIQRKPPFSIYTQDSLYYTHTDTAHFLLKVFSGKYTITCKYPSESDIHRIAVLRDIKLKPNEKVEVKFFYGETIW